MTIISQYANSNAFHGDNDNHEGAARQLLQNRVSNTPKYGQDYIITFGLLETLAL